VLVTGQQSFNGGAEAGGGVYQVSGGPADASRAYKYTIFFKPQNNLDHHLYFGAIGNVENASTGNTYGNQYFWWGFSNRLVQDRWYRIEGYVLPEGHALVNDDVYGGVFDTVTGDKIAKTDIYRFGPGGAEAGVRFFSHYGSSAGDSAQWYQPVVEKLDYTYALDDNAGGRFSINAVTGLVTANGTSFDRESAASHNIVARVTDAGGLTRTQTIAVTVDNVNETPNTPNNGTTIMSFFDETGLGVNPATAGGLVATVPVSDPDGTTPTLQFSRFNNYNGFEIVGNQIRFNATTNLNFEWFRDNGYSVYDWNGDGRLDVHISDTFLKASDGALSSSEGLVQVFISDVNERPNKPALVSSTLFSETLSGDTSHSGQIIANFTLADPDGTTGLKLVIVSGNETYNWFTISGDNQLAFNGANFSAGWLRDTKGQYGQDGDFYYDTDNDGLKEIRVATLTLAAEDAYGARSDTFEYKVLIEDKNEAPVWNTNSLSINLNENPGWYQHVGNVGGSDIDGPTSELRYAFETWDSYYDNNLGQWVTRSADQRFVLTHLGQVYINGTQDINFEDGLRTLSYSTRIYDKLFGANNTYSEGALNINIQDVNEPHVLASAARSRAEGNQPYPAIADPNSTYFDLPSIMLSDPENRAMTWTFADGTSTNGIWTIEGETGRLYLTYGSVDYDELIKVYDYVDVYEYDAETRQYIWSGQEWQWTGARNPALATQALSIKASDGTHSSVATFSATITDVNEGPTFSASAIKSGSTGGVIRQSDTNFWVTQDKNGAAIIQINPLDPEGVSQYFSYSVANIAHTEYNRTDGGSNEIDATGYPTVSVGTNGRITFSTPGEGNGEWEGGVKIGGTKRTSSVDVNFILNISDSGGATSSTPIKITFIRRGSSVPPIVIDLDGDGLELISYDTSTVNFDMDRDGIADKTGWVASDDGLLALDRNGNGTIDDISEISFVNDTDGALTDGEGLRAFDADGNGFLDGGDERFNEFLIWRDENQDGISQASELRTLNESGINSINLTLNATNVSLDTLDNIVFATLDVHREDGSITQAGDVFIAFDPSNFDPSVALPIVLDLDNDGEGLVSLADSTTRFDMNGDGVADKTGWIEAGDALLALDRNGNGAIDNIDEISFVNDREGAKTDLEGLVAFDSNGDGALDGSDERFVEFRAWVDANGNGTTDAGELLSLAQAEIISISLTGTPTGETVTSGTNIVFNTGNFTRAGGETGTLLDVGLAFTPLSQLPEIEFQQSDWSGKSRDYIIGGNGSSMRVIPRNAQGLLSEEAGLISPAAILSFGTRSIGMLSTILVDLDGDGLEARRANRNKAHFDMDADGIADDTGWVSGGDGMLVIDRDSDGAITHASELSFLSEKENAQSAWDGLSVLDTTRDGIIDASDARFGELKVWADRNADGISQAGEIQSLAELGITKIALRSQASGETARTGNNVPLSTATFTWENGVTATIGNVALGFDPSTAKHKPQNVSVTPALQTPEENAAALAASRLMQAVSAFGGGVGADNLSARWTERASSANDWLTVSA